MVRTQVPARAGFTVRDGSCSEKLLHEAWAQPRHTAQGLGQKEESKRSVVRGFLRKGGPASPFGAMR